MTAVYRMRQGVRALFAFSQPVDDALAAHHLTPAQLALFKRMTRSEQLHSLNVLRAVLRQSADTPADLAVAALLHDCGKSHYALSVWQRTLAVLAEKLLPGLSARLSAADSPADLTFWRAPFIIRRHHPAWGAQLLRATEASERTLWLVEHHAATLQTWQTHPDMSLLARLKQADDTH